MSKIAKNKSLTINNSDRYFNIHIKDKSYYNEFIKVTRDNEEEIEKELDELIAQSSRYKKMSNKKFMLFNEKYNNDRLIEKIVNYGKEIIFVTNTTVPFYIFKELSNKKNTWIVYQLDGTLTSEIIDNICLSFIGVKVIIDIPVVMPHTNPYDIIRQLYDVRTNVDEVHLSFPRISKPTEKQEKYYYKTDYGYDVYADIKFDYAQHIRVPLSVWKMYLYILTNTKQDNDELSTILQEYKEDNGITI